MPEDESVAEVLEPVVDVESPDPEPTENAAPNDETGADPAPETELTDDQIAEQQYEKTIVGDAGDEADPNAPQATEGAGKPPDGQDPAQAGQVTGTELIDQLASENGWDVNNPQAFREGINGFLRDVNQSVQEIRQQYSEFQNHPDTAAAMQLARQGPEMMEWFGYFADRLSRGYAPADIGAELQSGFGGNPGQPGTHPNTPNAPGNPQPPEFESDGERQLYQQSQELGQRLEQAEQRLAYSEQAAEQDRAARQAQASEQEAQSYQRDFVASEEKLAGQFPDLFESDQNFDQVVQLTLEAMAQERASSGRADVGRCMERACRYLDYPQAVQRGGQQAIARAKQNARKRSTMGQSSPAGVQHLTEDQIAEAEYNRVVGAGA